MPPASMEASSCASSPLHARPSRRQMSTSTSPDEVLPRRYEPHGLAWLGLVGVGWGWLGLVGVGWGSLGLVRVS
eukprot:scaffold64920_cov28-Phaeocystis_antarctica.AAC.1